MGQNAVTTGREYTDDRGLNDLWTRVEQLSQFLAKNPLVNGRLLTEEDGAVRNSGLSFTVGTTRSIAHKLGRKAIGFVEVYGADAASSSHVGLCATSHPSGITSETHVTLTPAATGTAFVWVF